MIRYNYNILIFLGLMILFITANYMTNAHVMGKGGFPGLDGIDSNEIFNHLGNGNKLLLPEIQLPGGKLGIGSSQQFPQIGGNILNYKPIDVQLYIVIIIYHKILRFLIVIMVRL